MEFIEESPVVKKESIVFLYDSAENLWQDLIKEWQNDSDSILVFPSKISKELFLSEFAQDTLLGKRVILLGDLWHQIAEQIKQLSASESRYPLPSTVSAEMLLIFLKEAIVEKELKTLFPLLESDDNLLALIEYIDLIEEKLDYNFHPEDEINYEIKILKNYLHKIGKTSVRGFYSAVSRQANLISLSYSKIIFAPFREYTPQIGGLLKGLSIKNEVISFLLSSKSGQKDLLDCLSLGADVLDKSSSFLTVKERFSQLKSLKEVKFLETIENTQEDQVRAALIQGEEQKQSSQFILATPNTEKWLSDVLRESERQNKDLLYRAVAKSNRFVLAEVLLKIHNPEGSLLAWKEETTSLTLSLDSEDFVFTLIDEIRSLFQAYNLKQFEISLTGVERLRFLYQLGILLDQDFKNSSALWLNNLLELINIFEFSIEKNNQEINKTLTNETISRILKANRTQPKLFGDINNSSVILVGYNDLASIGFSSAGKFLLGFNDYVFDSNSVQPFWDKTLLRKHPELKRNSFWQEIDSALLTKPFILRNEKAPLVSLKTQEQKSLKLKQEDSEWKFPPLEELLVDSIEKPISISELISICSCPLGWYVDYKIKPYRVDRQAIEEGELMHSILESFPDSYREVKDISCQSNLFFNKKEAELFAIKVWRISDNFNTIASDLPLRETEKSISGKLELNLGGDIPKEVFLKGRIDRIDWNEEKNEFLIVDYKRGSPPEIKDAWQILLYPKMLIDYYQEEFNKKITCRGAVYVSAKTGHVSGFYQEAKEGYRLLSKKTKEAKFLASWGGEGFGYKNQYNKTAEQIAKSLTDLSDNTTLLPGKNCLSYCSHFYVQRKY